MVLLNRINFYINYFLGFTAFQLQFSYSLILSKGGSQVANNIHYTVKTVQINKKTPRSLKIGPDPSNFLKVKISEPFSATSKQTLPRSLIPPDTIHWQWVTNFQIAPRVPVDDEFLPDTPRRPKLEECPSSRTIRFTVGKGCRV